MPTACDPRAFFANDLFANWLRARYPEATIQ